MQNFSFRAFKAIDEIATCLKFKEQHSNVLKDYGIIKITSNSDAWMYNPNIYCVIAESAFTDLVGGVRIQVSTEKERLPVELAIGKMDNRIFEVVGGYRDEGGVAEICALWNAKAVAGSGISTLLIRSAIAVAEQLKIRSLITICADYTLKRFQDAGFHKFEVLGKEGYPYPNETYSARVLSVVYSNIFKMADKTDSDRIRSLQKEPVQTFVEEVQEHKVTIDYKLKLKL